MTDMLFASLPRTARPPRRDPLPPTLPADPSLGALRCDCGASKIISVKPGQDAVRLGATDLFTRKEPVIEPATRDRGYCLACLCRDFPGLRGPRLVPAA